mgnify:FL=1
MAYLGTPIDTTNQFQSLQGKRFSGDASTTAFTLDIAPNSVFDIEVFVENVRQDPNSSYTLNGTTLTFSAAPPSGTNNIYVIHQAKAVGTITAPVGGSIDMNGVELVLDEDGDTSVTADTDDQIDFRAGGTDTMHVVNGKVGITSVPDLGAGLHIITSDTGGSVNGNGDELVIEANGNAGLSILTGNSNTGTIFFADADDSNIGGILYDHATDSAAMTFRVGDAVRFTIDASGNFGFNRTATATDTNAFGAFISSTGEFNNAKDVNGSNNVSEFSGNAGQLRIRGDGDAENTNNSYGSISDRTLKENETSAKSQWDDIKALEIKNYNLIAYPDRPHLGVIAQDLESAGMTGLVKTDSEGIKSVKYSVLYMKAVKALQEAMTKIEDLETRVKTLEG